MMRVHTILEPGLGNAAYLAVPGGGCPAVAIDPPRDPARLVAAARSAAVALALETHLHADFVSGAPELAAAGASHVAPAAAGLVMPHRGVAAGARIEVDGLGFEVLATPGHTPEHVAYLAREAGRPVALFSGGALTAGGVARTDLISPDHTEGLARDLYRVLREQIFTLPDDLAVYPTHGAGSFCSAGSSRRHTTTIGDERHTHPAALAQDEDAFVAGLLAGYGTFPAYFLRLRDRNRRGFPLLRSLPSLPRLEIDAFDRAVRDGAEVVDVRPTAAFAAGHVPGALSIALRPQFASWFGWLVELDRRAVFVLDADQDRAELVRQCHLIGHDAVLGELDAGVAAWQAAGRELRTVPEIDAEAAAARIVVDVRQRAEVLAGAPAASMPMELGALAARVGELPRDAPLAVTCGHGERSMTGVSILLRAGFERLANLKGGTEAWQAAGLPWR